MPETHKKDYIAGFTVDDIAEDFYALYLTSKKYKRDTSIQLKVNAQKGNWIIGQVDYQTGDMDITTNHKYPEEAKMVEHFKEGIAIFLERINDKGSESMKSDSIDSGLPWPSPCGRKTV